LQKKPERSSGLRVDSTKVRGLFCKMTETRPIWAVRAPDPTAGISRRRGLLQGPRIPGAFVIRRFLFLCSGVFPICCNGPPLHHVIQFPQSPTEDFKHNEIGEQVELPQALVFSCASHVQRVACDGNYDRRANQF
jgi:hypothetical protein